MEKIFDFTIDCPFCGKTTKPIPKYMGDQRIKCTHCGKYMVYLHRKDFVEKAERPERVVGSGIKLY
jgi:transposase-like protein